MIWFGEDGWGEKGHDQDFKEKYYESKIGREMLERFIQANYGMTCEECDGEDECYDDCRCEDCIQAGIDRMESMNDID